jgi:hypothetical protein
MDRFLDTSLRVGLAAAALGSVVMLALMVIDLFLPLRWNWYNALAFFSATTLLAGARFLHSAVASATAAREAQRTFG